MKPIVEDLVARKNNFAKWLNLTFAFIFLATALKVAFRGISFSTFIIAKMLLIFLHLENIGNPCEKEPKTQHKYYLLFNSTPYPLLIFSFKINIVINHANYICQ